MLMNVIIISAAVHIAAGLILGGITIVKYVIPDDTQFKESPAIQEEQPPPEVKVTIKQPPPKLDQSLNNLKMKQIGNIAVNDVNVNLPGMEDSFTVSAGLGNFSGGSLMGKAGGRLGIGMSDVSVFGLKAKAERILFIIDASNEMVIDKKGGLNSYKIIKDEISDMVGNLSAGTLFNVAVYDRRDIKFFKPQLVPAGAEVSGQLTSWIAPVNSTSKTGIRGGTKMKLSTFPEDFIQGQIENYSARGNETLTLTQLALEQDVDAIFIITGFHRGFMNVRRNTTDAEESEWERITSRKQYQDQLAAHKAEIPVMKTRIKNELAKINQQRASQGLPPRVLNSQWATYSQVSDLGLKWNTKHPGWKTTYFDDLTVKPSQLASYFRKVLEEIYLNRNKKEPSINVVLFLAGDEKVREEHEDSLKDYTRVFNGNHRIIRGLNEIRNARTAKDTKN